MDRSATVLGQSSSVQSAFLFRCAATPHTDVMNQEAALSAVTEMPETIGAVPPPRSWSGGTWPQGPPAVGAAAVQMFSGDHASRRLRVRATARPAAGTPAVTAGHHDGQFAGRDEILGDVPELPVGVHRCHGQ